MIRFNESYDYHCVTQIPCISYMDLWSKDHKYVTHIISFLGLENV